MKIDQIWSCYIGPHISPEAFIAEHIFIYLLKGKMEGYDGHKSYTLLPGQYCIVRRNHLARYNKLCFQEVIWVSTYAIEEVITSSILSVSPPHYYSADSAPMIFHNIRSPFLCCPGSYMLLPNYPTHCKNPDGR